MSRPTRGRVRLPRKKFRSGIRHTVWIAGRARAEEAGMPLRDEEVRALLSGASAAADPRFCPHGRPTGIEITRGEIERRFQRK